MRKLLFVCLLLCISSMVHAQTSAMNPDGLSMSFRVGQSKFEPGEPIDFTLNLVNQSNEAISYQFANMDISDFWVTDTAGREIWRYSNGKSFAGKRVLNLDPGNSKTCRATWNQTDNQGKAVAPGWYECYAKFSGAKRDVEPLHFRIKIDQESSNSVTSIIMVPVKGGTINPSTDIGKNVSIEGILKQGPQGLYIEVRNVRVAKQTRGPALLAKAKRK